MKAERPDIDPKGLYTPTKAAEALGVAARTIYRWEAAGKLRPRLRKSTGRRVYQGSDLLRLWGSTI